MITNFELLDIYRGEGNLGHSSLKLTSGMRFNLLDQPNLLLVGCNGSGKTTLLHMLYESIKRRREYEQGDGLQLNSVYQRLVREIGDVFSSEDDSEHEHELEIDSWKNVAFSGISTILSYSNYTLNPHYRCSQNILETVIRNSDSNFDVANIPSSTYDGLALSAKYLPIFAAEYAQVNNLDAEVLFGNLALLESGVLGLMATDLNMWRYIKCEGDVLKSDVSGSYVIPGLKPHAFGDNRAQITEPSYFGKAEVIGGSLGERNKHLIDSAKSGIWLLDEPTNGIARKDKKQYMKQLIQSSAQIITTTHEDGLINVALEHNGWQVYDLDTQSLLDE